MSDGRPGGSQWERVAPRLKDFQRRTVEHCFDRLFRDPDRSERILIADEVGLGKTLVAKGLIAKTVDHLAGTVERVDIIYVCSNAGIARQNIQRLRLDESAEGGFVRATRPGLLPLELAEAGQRKISYISLTPGTGLEATDGGGVARERAFLAWLLLRRWSELSETQVVNVLRLTAGADRLRRELNRVRDDVRANRVDLRLVEDISNQLTDALKGRIEALCRAFQRSNARIDDATAAERRDVVSELRRMVGRTCLRSLRPDLVILDEFQRFKALLDDENYENDVARELLNYADGEESVRVVLLSATPYKMYTTAGDSQREGGDDHYADFLGTMRFLTKAKERPERHDRIVAAIAAWKRAIPRVADGDAEAVIRARRELEGALSAFICRTERLASTSDRSGMLRDVRTTPVELSAADVRRFLEMARVSDACEQGDSIEYWKSAPYALNFMDKYAIKDELRDRIRSRESGATRGLSAAQPGLLTRVEIEKLERLDRGHARLRSLVDHIESIGLFDRLWMPPTLAYWKSPAGVPEQGPMLTKQLVFSSWKVVPKAVTALLNHEASRRARRAAGGDPTMDISNRLRLDVDDAGHPRTSIVMALTYPSTALASLVDPAEWAGREIDIAGARELTRRALEPQFQAMLARRNDPSRTRADERWYWAAPIFLDRSIRNRLGEDIFGDQRFVDLWSKPGADDSGGDESVVDRRLKPRVSENVHAHVSELRSAATTGLGLGAPPADLLDVLVDMALGHPAVLVLRSLARLTGNRASAEDTDLRFTAAKAAFAFRSLFNSGHAAALVDSTASREPYWRKTLEYCVHAQLPSVVDEHVHMLIESLGRRSRMAQWGRGQDDWAEAVREIGATLSDTIFMSATTVRFDEFKFGERGHVKTEKVSLSGHFASRFTEEKDDDERGDIRARQDALRLAFNGPFFPFVLATTSVGQEGLDFHTYCHSVVHWNLPSNPVDLEQREGRVHRYKNHAVRKNIARRFGPTVHVPASTDPWDLLFREAEATRAPGHTEMFPYWVCPDPEGSAIERRVLAFPLSRDSARHDALIRSLAVYRLVFGQPRQEELLRYLSSRLPAADLTRIATELRICLEPRIGQRV